MLVSTSRNGAVDVVEVSEVLERIAITFTRHARPELLRLPEQVGGLAGRSLTKGDRRSEMQLEHLGTGIAS